MFLFHLIFGIILVSQLIHSTGNEEPNNNIDSSISTVSSYDNNTDVVDNSYSGNISDIIPPIYILNLDRSKDRWEHAKLIADEAKLTVSRLSAVDGRKLSNLELRKNSTRIAMYFQPRGVIGCYLSHRKFWQLVVDKNLSSAIIFEDDITLVDGFKSKLENSLKNLRNDNLEATVDVLLIGAIGRVHPNGSDALVMRFFSAYVGGSRPLRKINDHIYQPVRPAGTHAYLVTNHGAKKLLKLCPKAVYHVDLDAWRHQSLIIYMLNPMLAFQTFASTSLTDVTKTITPTKRKGIIKRLFDSPRIQRWTSSFTIDPVTHQPLSHVLDEPLLQLGPSGPVLTVERNAMVVASGVIAAGLLRACGYHYWSRIALTGVASFIVGVRSLIWLLMHWK